MKTSGKLAAFIVFAIALWGWSQTGPLSMPDTQVSIPDIARSYTNYHRMTKSAVSVNPDFAMLCRGVSQEEVKATLAEFGPHANANIMIYMNKLAADAFNTNASAYPADSVIVKQKSFGGYLGMDGKPAHDAEAGVGGMVKRSPGYDPLHGDWEYFYFEDAGKIESGPISSCVQCHESAKGKDYIFGTWSKSAQE